MFWVIVVAMGWAESAQHDSHCLISLQRDGKEACSASFLPPAVMSGEKKKETHNETWMCGFL